MNQQSNPPTAPFPESCPEASSSTDIPKKKTQPSVSANFKRPKMSGTGNYVAKPMIDRRVAKPKPAKKKTFVQKGYPRYFVFESKLKKN